MFLPLPFSSKELPNGKRLFRRKHGYTLELAANGTTVYTVSVPYLEAKINEAEVLWCPEGVTVDMKVKDTPSGTISGIPNFMLNQFGFNVVVNTGDFKDISQYDADVIQNMQLEFTFNNTSNISKTIGINVVFHEIK